MNANTRRKFLLTLAVLALVPQRLFAAVTGFLRKDELEQFSGGPGETVYLMRGEEHGYDSLSLIITNTQPQGGPPLHTHECEEMHIIESGTLSYVVGDERFTRVGPFIQRIPARVPHAFINSGTTPFKLHAVFPSKHYTFKFIAPNPLQVGTGEKKS